MISFMHIVLDGDFVAHLDTFPKSSLEPMRCGDQAGSF